LKNIVTYPLVIFLLDYYFSLIFYVLGAIILGLGSVFIKKSDQIEILFFKKTKTETKPVQTDWFRFGFFRKKPIQTGLT